MEKFTVIMMIVWAVLAIASFVASFWSPLFIKVLGLVFGTLNISLIGGWVFNYFQEKKNNKLMEE